MFSVTDEFATRVRGLMFKTVQEHVSMHAERTFSIVGQLLLLLLLYMSCMAISFRSRNPVAYEPTCIVSDSDM